MHPRFAPILFGFLVSGMMSLIVTCVATWRVLGLVEGFWAAWMSAWSLAWPVAFATILVVAPAVRRFVAKLVREPGA